MKIVYLLLISLFLNANCSKAEAKRANEFFTKATQSDKPIELLKESLKLCFTYEVEFSLLNLQVEQSSSREEKLRLYDEMLETLSNIKSNDRLVISEQSRINRLIAKMYEKDTPLLSNIYKNKVEAQNDVKRGEPTNYYLFLILLFLLLFIWVFWDFLKKLGIFLKDLV